MEEKDEEEGEEEGRERGRRQKGSEESEKAFIQSSNTASCLRYNNYMQEIAVSCEN